MKKRKRKKRNPNGEEEPRREESPSSEDSGNARVGPEGNGEEGEGPSSPPESSKSGEEDREEALRAMEDKLKRALADMANMRRRQAEDRRRIEEGAMEKICHEFLPILDSFEMALASDSDAEALYKGLRMVHGMMEDLLGRHGVLPIPAEGKAFDPRIHEAVSMVESEEIPAGTIVSVQQKGFIRGERVLRPARVVVSNGPPPKEEDSSRCSENPGEPDSSGPEPAAEGGGEDPSEKDREA